MKKFLLLSALLVCGAASALAQEPVPQGPPPQGPRSGQGGGFQMRIPNFAELDKNGDKKLARDEFPGPQQFFDRIDENRDGFIEEAEWNKIRERMGGGGGARFSETLVKFMDADGDAKISRDEFAKITEIFDALDRDHDGTVSQEEMGRFFQAVNETQTKATGGVEAANLFEKFDKNKDGKIVADEMNNERTFKALDLDKDGSVTRQEAETALRQLAERSRRRQAQP